MRVEASAQNFSLVFPLCLEAFECNCADAHALGPMAAPRALILYSLPSILYSSPLPMVTRNISRRSFASFRNIKELYA